MGLGGGNGYPLHEAVYRGDVRLLASLLRHGDLNAKDPHGNTPLHIAVMLGRKECVQLLLAHGAPVKSKNMQGWTPLAEAVSYGDRQTISSLLRKLKLQAKENMEERRPDLVKALNMMGDFYMEFKWDFHSWVPLLSRMLPSDTCVIHKKGSHIRLDTTLVDFNDMKWERGDISFVFLGDADPPKALVVMDNKSKVYQRVRYEESEAEIEDEVDILMSSDIVTAHMSTKTISCTRAQSGWLFRSDRTEMIGNFNANFYSLGGIILETHKRREHLSPEDLQKNKQMMESLAQGNSAALDPLLEQTTRRSSLTPPQPSGTSWDQYISSAPGFAPQLGRPMVYKTSAKCFKATVAMSPDFPITVDMLLNVLEVIAPFKHISKLREFVQLRLPPGFPVKIDVPVLPTVTATITFQDFRFCSDLSKSLFEVPAGYREDPTRFPDL